jgi:hypothetical protein
MMRNGVIVAAVWMAACAAGGDPMPKGDGSGGAGGTASTDSGGVSGSGTPPISLAGGGGASAGGPGVTISDVVGRPVEPAEWQCGATCALVDVPANTPSLFEGGTPTTSSPTLLYPLQQSMHAINLPDITFQWRKGSAEQTLFRIRLASATTTYDFHVGCGAIEGGEADECAFHMPEGNWIEMAVANRGGSVNVEVAGVDASGGALGVSTPTELLFSPASVTGGLYYWSTEIRGSYRLLFGARQAEPLITPASDTNPAACGGCHAVSRDGTRIAFSAGEPAESAKLIVSSTSEPETKSVAPGSSHDAGTLALSPDGKLVLSAYIKAGSGQVLELRNADDGTTLATWNRDHFGNRSPFHPEFSPDGKAVVVTLASDQIFDWSVRDGSIAVLSFDPATNTLGAPEVIVPFAPDNNFYPTWSPDGRWIAFASAPANGSRASYDQQDARIRLVAREGGAAVDLTRATQRVGATSTMPKFAPFMQDDGNVMFITTNSKLDYGAILKNSPRTHDQQKPQLWMAAIDLRRVNTGDPSWAPVWLPFQDITQTNHLGYWTEVLTCKQGGCGGEDVVCDVGASGTGTCVFQVE